MKRLALIAVVACQRVPERAPDPVKPEPVPIPVTPAPTPTKDFAPPLPDELQRWMKRASLDAWKGVWTTQLAFRATDDEKPFSIMGDDDGDPMALEITGARGRAYDGRRDYTVDLAIVSPCTARLKADVGEPNLRQFVVVNGRARFGSGSGGYRDGQDAIVCSSLPWFGIVTFDAGKCLRWRQDGSGKWESRDFVSCSWRVIDGKDQLVLLTSGSYGGMGAGTIQVDLNADGDVLVDHRLKAGAAKAAPDYDVARAAIRDDFVKRDPGELAKAAGGKVGDATSVLGLVATFGADRGSVLGKSVTISGHVVAVQGSQGLVLGAKPDAPFGVYCISSKLTVKHRERARITGKVRQLFGMVALDDCVAERLP